MSISIGKCANLLCVWQVYDGQWWWGERQSHILHERPSAEAEGLECCLHLQWWGFELQLFRIVKILIVYLLLYLIWFSWCEWTRVIERFVRRSICICSRTGEIPPPVHAGALWETVWHEDRSLGHRTHHRAENRCEPVLQQANTFYIYIYAFSRRFYPKRLTVHSGYTFFCQYVCSLGIEPTTFALLAQCSNHWATGTQ